MRHARRLAYGAVLLVVMWLPRVLRLKAVGHSVTSTFSKMYVISLDGVEGADPRNKGRLKHFIDDWTNLCGGQLPMEMEWCPGYLDKRRGFGVTKGLVHCTEKAIKDGVPIAYFFEDDARLFDAKFCHNDHRTALWENAPADTYLLMLGGHNFVADNQNTINSRFQPLQQSYGTYGFAVPQKNLKSLHDGYRRDIAPGKHFKNGNVEEATSPDLTFYNFAKKNMKSIYACNPLYVKHVAGWSNTWKKARDEIASTEINIKRPQNTHERNELGYNDGETFVSTALRPGKCQQKGSTWAKGFKEGYFINFDDCPVSVLSQLNLSANALAIAVDEHTTERGHLAYCQALNTQTNSNAKDVNLRMLPSHPSLAEILHSTVLAIKTYNRPNCLQDLLKSVAKFAPDLPLIIADDSLHSNKQLAESIPGLNIVRYLRLAVDSGAGYGRNQLVAAAKEKGFKYLVMSDDDYVMTSELLVLKLAELMVELKADIVAPVRCDAPHWKCVRGEIAALVRGTGSGASGGDELFMLNNVTRAFQYEGRAAASSKYRCQRTDIVQQFFLASVDMLIKSGWDDKLKNNDHYDAMLSMQREQMRLYTCSALKIHHQPTACSVDQGQYSSVRFNRWMALMPYVLKKWNIEVYHDEVGRRWSVNQRTGIIQTQCGEACIQIPDNIVSNATVWFNRLEKSKAVSLPTTPEYAIV